MFLEPQVQNVVIFFQQICIKKLQLKSSSKVSYLPTNSFILNIKKIYCGFKSITNTVCSTELFKFLFSEKNQILVCNRWSWILLKQVRLNFSSYKVSTLCAEIRIFCRSLAQKMLPIAGGGKFASIGDKIRLPDDVTMGYIAEQMLNLPLTVVTEFHSHLEPQRLITPQVLSEQISFSYSKYGDEMNVVDVDGYFSNEDDPTR